MGKEFIEYQSQNGRMPYHSSEVCFCLTNWAKSYIKTKRPLTKNIDKDVRDAILVDAINYIGACSGCDFALYTKDLYDNRHHEEEVDDQCLLTILKNYLSFYIFSTSMVESVKRNHHMNNCKQEFTIAEGATILIDFINFVSLTNGYDKRFTLSELNEQYKTLNYKSDMRELREFLESTSSYTEELRSGEGIDCIFNDVAKKHNLKTISKKGVYYYTDEIKERLGRIKMHPWDVKELEREIYAMAYAYGKLKEEKDASLTLSEPKTPIILRKIKEMSQK